MKKLQPALAASLGVLVGLAAFMPMAVARDGGFGGHAGGFDGSAGRGPYGPGGAGYNGYGPVPGRTNPYASNAWVGPVDINPYVNGTVPNTSNTPPANDCNYLFKKATDTGDNYWWGLFNNCAHGR